MMEIVSGGFASGFLITVSYYFKKKSAIFLVDVSRMSYVSTHE